MRTLARSMWSKLTRATKRESDTHADARSLSHVAGSAGSIVRTHEVKTRRGTFLVLVVGTLALLSVIAIVYVTIGTQDTRVQTAAAKREKVEDIPQRVGDYIAEVVGRDRLATYYDDATIRPTGAPVGSIPVLMREISDYPYTDLLVRSDDSNPHASWRFDPSGRIDTQYWTGPAGAIRASVPPSDPWLATSEPTWIGVDPADASQLGQPTDVTRLYRDMKDWGHISNFAPNGRFVNLFNLRDNFNAAPGTSPGQMSSGLTLYDATGEATNQTIFGEPADPDVPALWSNQQRGAARPAAFVPYGAAAGLSVEDPSGSNFKLYQWADADGDGVLDSRWFELIDDRGGITNLLGDTGKYRFFIAARAVDLSGRVNVNFATDFRTAARPDAPAGVTPADVDLLRLLSLTDSYDFNSPVTVNDLIGGYDNLRNPPAAIDAGRTQAGNYAPAGGGGDQLAYPVTDLDTGYGRNRGLQVANFSYAALRMSVAAGFPFGTSTIDGAVSLQGDELITDGPAAFSLAPQAWDTSDAKLGAARRRAAYQRNAVSLGTTATPLGWNSSVRFTMPDLAELLTRNSVNDPDVTSTLELVLGGRDNTTNGPIPGSARYSPLRDNRDLKLELSAIPDAAYDQPIPGFDGNGAAAVGSPLEAFEARYLAQMQTDVRQRLTTLSGAVPLRPVRGVHPWVLATNELPTDIGAILDPEYDLFDTLDQVSTGTPFNAVRPVVRVDSAESKSIFRAYADQLLPFSGVTIANANTWELGSRVGGELQTLAYGYRGPEVPLYAAAHMTVNFADMVDRERVTKNNNDPANPLTYDDDYELNIPTVYTLIVRGDSNDVLGTGRTPAPFDANGDDKYIGDIFTVANPLDGRELNLNAVTLSTRLPELGDTSQVTVTPPDQEAVNVFGIEAQPFLTRVSVFTTYMDQGTPTDGSQRFELNVSLRQANQEFAYRVVAWQLTNPFNVPVVLWDNAQEGTATNQTERPPSRYYVEMDGRTYLIRPLTDGGTVYNVGDIAAPSSDRSIVIYPQRSIVLYTLSETPTAIATRIGRGFTAGDVRDVVQNALGEISADDPGDTGAPVPLTYTPDRTKFQAMYYIGAVNATPGVNPRTIDTPANVTFNTLLTHDRPETRLWRRIRTLSQVSLGGGGGAVSPIEFDQLVDRLRVPEGDPGAPVDADSHPILNRRLGDPAMDTSDQQIQIGNVFGDAPGWSDPVLTLWASVRRPANPGEPPMGALPAYCMEPKGSTRWNVFNNDGFDTRSGTWNPLIEMPRTGAWTLDDGDFMTGVADENDAGNNAYASFADWRQSVRANNFTYKGLDPAGLPEYQLNEDDSPAMLNIVPNRWGTRGPGVQPTTRDMRTLVGNSDRTDGSGATISASNADRFNPLLPQTQFYNQWYAQVAINNYDFYAPNDPVTGQPVVRSRSIRVADMLMPLAVGPVMNPAFASDDSPDSGSSQLLTGRDWTNMELRWTTLGESMAIALGYQPTIGAQNDSSLDPLDVATLVDPFSTEQAWHTAYSSRPLFDRGQLRLDEFVLFRDLNANGIFNYLSDGGGVGQPDRRVFTEMPAALGILDSFTVAPVGSSSIQGGMQFVYGGFPKERSAADLTQPVPGLININTAPPTVIRALPGMAPWNTFGVNEVQRIEFANNAQGDFSLRTPAGIAPATISVSAAISGGLRSHIESIPGIGVGNVAVNMVSIDPPTFDVEFVGALAATDAPALAFSDNVESGQLNFSVLQAFVQPTLGPTWANGSVLDRDVDLAATVVASRDKTRQFLRPQSTILDATVTNAGLNAVAVRDTLDPDAATGAAAEQLSFFDREPGVTGPVALRDLFWPQGVSTNQLQDWLDNREGRRARTEILGISEREGFTTIGAIQAAASVRDGNPNSDRLTGLNAGVLEDIGAMPVSIDFMGFQTTPIPTSPVNQQLFGANLRVARDTSHPGLTSSLYPMEWVNDGNRANRNKVAGDSIPGDYMEKLTPIAAISNIATTRSDYFAVWFVIHGYTQDDVTGLAPTDPMSPSIARRFLMVLDRSNVVSASQQRPKVVLFREVPYTP